MGYTVSPGAGPDELLDITEPSRPAPRERRDGFTPGDRFLRNPHVHWSLSAWAPGRVPFRPLALSRLGAL